MALFPEREIKQVALGVEKICIVRTSETDFFAFERACPHRLADLSQGWVTPAGEVVCPLHQYRFDLLDGKNTLGDCRDLVCFRTELTDGGLIIFL